MKKLLFNLMLIAAFGIVGYRLANRNGNTSVNFGTVDQSDQAPVKACRAQKTCVIAYVAPWCPACHQFVSRIPLYRDRLAAKEVGLLLVVGAEDDMQKKVDFVKQLGPLAVLDSPGDAFRKAHKVEYFPTFIVTDSNGDVIADGRKGQKKLNELLD
ncbi:MAG: redoxin family protein [Bdellovibrionota bacterium]